MNSLWKRNAKMTFSHLELRFQREFRVLTQLFLKYRYGSTQNCKRKTVPEALDLLPHVGICVSGFLRRVQRFRPILHPEIIIFLESPLKRNAILMSFRGGQNQLSGIQNLINGSSWDPFGPTWCPLGLTGDHPGPIGDHLGPHVDPVGTIGDPLGPTGDPFGPIGDPCGSIGEPSGNIGVPLGSIGVPFGSIEDSLWPVGDPFASAGDPWGPMGGHVGPALPQSFPI